MADSLRQLRLRWIESFDGRSQTEAWLEFLGRIEVYDPVEFCRPAALGTLTMSSGSGGPWYDDLPPSLSMGSGDHTAPATAWRALLSGGERLPTARR